MKAKRITQFLCIIINVAEEVWFEQLIHINIKMFRPSLGLGTKLGAATLGGSKQSDLNVSLVKKN